MLPVAPEAQAQLLNDVAAFVASIAQIRCQNILKSDFKEQSFIKLIVNDGNSTHVFAHGVSGASLAERRHVEQERSLVERRIFALCEFRDRYAFLLRFLERELSLEQCEETINLYDLVTGTCLNAGYFVKVSLTDAVAGQHCMHTRPTMLPEKVFVGGFALELALLLETPVEKWLLQCEERIDALLKQPNDQPQSCREAAQRRTLRRRLTILLAQHLALVGLYKPNVEDEIVLEKTTQTRSSIDWQTEFQDLLDDCADENVKRECEQARESTLLRLKLLQELITKEPTEARMQLFIDHQSTILQTLQSPPAILTKRSNFDRYNFRFFVLRSIVAASSTAAAALSVVKLKEYRHALGPSLLDKITAFLADSIDLVRKQRFPDRAFLPTLKSCAPPPPTWVHADDSAYLARAANDANGAAAIDLLGAPA